MINTLHQAPLSPEAQRVADILKRYADEMRTVEFGEIEAETGYGVHTHVPWLLDEILRSCDTRGLPWLTAIVVLKKDRRPGSKWRPRQDEPFDKRTDEHLWRGMVSQVFAYDWSNVSFGP